MLTACFLTESNLNFGFLGNLCIRNSKTFAKLIKKQIFRLDAVNKEVVVIHRTCHTSTASNKSPNYGSHFVSTPWSYAS